MFFLAFTEVVFSEEATDDVSSEIDRFFMSIFRLKKIMALKPLFPLSRSNLLLRIKSWPKNC